MNKIILLVSVLFSLTVYSQPEPCATDFPDEMMDWLTEYKSNQPANAQKAGGETDYYIPLKIHIVGNDQGGGYHRMQFMLDALCTLNEQFEPTGFHFYIYNGFNFINNTNLYNHTGNYIPLLASQKVANAANIYIVGDPSGACGYYTPWTDIMAIKNSCASPNNTTIAHEVGHFFSMPHTFSGWEDRTLSTDSADRDDERVNGSNCSFAGDRFCDTPADFFSNRWNCPFNKTKTDFVGDQYQVDGTLFMSYANDACQNRFSDEQIDAMRAYLLARRADLLIPAAPSNTEVGEVTQLYPPDNTTGVPSNYLNLKWSKAEGATQYHLLVTRLMSGIFFNLDTIVADTSVVISKLDPGFNYRWKVRPFNSANTCTDYTFVSNVRLGEPTSIVPSTTISSVSCPGGSNGQIILSATGGTEPYTFEWSNGDSTAVIFNLERGNYVVKIKDAIGDSLEMSFDVTSPDSLATTLNVDSNYNIQAPVIGGTPPYFYQWSTFEVTASITAPDNGEYSLTVTDNNGCVTQDSVEIANFPTGVNEFELQNLVKIYPNPVNNSNTLRIEYNNGETADIQLFDNTGKQIKSLFSVSIVDLDISDVQAGVYFVRIIGSKATVNKRVVIF